MSEVEKADLRLVTQAANFAAHAHRAQRRKDSEATPYINHLTEVAFLLADAGCASEYVHWAHRVVSSLPDKNPRLLQQYDAIREMLLPRSGD